MWFMARSLKRSKKSDKTSLHPNQTNPNLQLRYTALYSMKPSLIFTTIYTQFEILVNECECKIIKYGLAELSKLMKNSKLSETPFFFSILASNTAYKLAASTEDERSKWIITIKSLAVRMNINILSVRYELLYLIVIRERKKENQMLGLRPGFWYVFRLPPQTNLNVLRRETIHQAMRLIASDTIRTLCNLSI